MTDDFDFYDLLDVPPDASQDEIKRAFRTQVRVYHPDLNDDDRARAQFTALKKAYDILGDPVERRAYDRLGHEDYVAKRTKGLPSPDVWKSSSEKTSESNDSSRSSGPSGSSRTTESTASSTATSASASATSSSAGTASASSSSARTRAETGSRTRATGTTDGGTTTARSGGSGAGANATARRGARTGTRTAGDADNAFVRWWRAQNFAWPLIWIAALTYLAGLVHFAIGNESGLRALANELRAVGTDLAALQETLTSGRYGLETPLEFVVSVEFFTPPLPWVQWYAALAGLVGLALAAVLGARVAWRRETWGPVTIDETIVVALALGVSAVLVGGPLLAGALLMPLLFGVIVFRTRKLPGWSPSVLFVAAVCTPLLGFAAGAAGYATLPGEFLAYVLVPLAGAFGLPLRATIRKRFGK